MAAQGVDVEVLSFALRDRTILNRLQGSGITVHCWDDPRVYRISHIIRAIRFFRRKKYDLIHLHLFPAMLYALIGLFRIEDRPVVIIHEHNTTNRRRHKLFRPLDSWMYSKADRIVSITPEVEQALINWIPGLARKCLVIPNGITEEEIVDKPYRDRHPDARAGVLRVLSLGRCVHQKGFDVLIRAVAATSGVFLQIAGDGPLKASLRKLAAELGADDRVAFLGTRHDVPDLLERADAYVQSSRYDGFAIAALEALGSGLPVVFSAVAGMAQVIGESAGLSFPNENHEVLAGNLARLRDDLQLREDLGRDGVTRARQFMCGESSQRFVSLYRELCCTHK
jgi:glycosyltransferase involved in cell wall biosynthesis